MSPVRKTMRDTLISRMIDRMASSTECFFLTADLGAPALDEMRERFPGRCINVGIAEQNLIAVAAGLALEGAIVCAYGIAPFVSMRAFEQLRTTVSLLSQTRALNLHVLSLGAGFSYDVSGPSHQCIEDIPLLRLLPHIGLYSPSDWVSAGLLLDKAIERGGPSYHRLDGKPLPALYDPSDLDLDRGFDVLRRGVRHCLVTTGYATHLGIQIAERALEQGITVGHVDLFALKNRLRSSFRPLGGPTVIGTA